MGLKIRYLGDREAPTPTPPPPVSGIIITRALCTPSTLTYLYRERVEVMGMGRLGARIVAREGGYLERGQSIPALSYVLPITPVMGIAILR